VTSTTSYVQQPVTHKVINVGNALFRAICVINESAGNEALTTMEAGFSGEAEVVNRWFRSYRLALEPGEATPTHRHATPAVVVQIAEGRLLAAGPMKWELNEPGRWAWFGAGDAHTIRNASDTRVELVEVEVRVP
jgi:quercetin dioxygenase-like cupin family protein